MGLQELQSPRSPPVAFSAGQSGTIISNTAQGLSAQAQERGKVIASRLETGSVQPSTTYDPTKSPGTRQLGTTVVGDYRVYRVGKERERQNGLWAGRGADPERRGW